MECLVIFVLLGAHLATTLGCGTTTHLEIGHRATEYFEDHAGGVDYKKLILDNQDAFQGGNPYPDAFYPSICKGGKFHQVSEDSHWVPFLNATINYIRRVYPKPWDKETEKLVVFMLGFVSHQVADVSWHSLGIDQGFLTTMGDIDFHGSFDAAHSVGDIGGDIVAEFEFNLSYIDILSDWYIPTKDLVEIYKDLYGEDIVDSNLIEECTALLFLERLGEKLAIAKLFPDYASKSPFMVEQFQSYFLGGLDDMATWSTIVWHEAIFMLNNGTSACDLPRNPIYISCNKSSTARSPVMSKGTGKLAGLHTNGNLHGLTPDLVAKRRAGRGVYFTASKTLQRQIQLLREERSKAAYRSRLTHKANALKSSPYLRSTFTTSNSYAHLGWSLLTADVNGDSIDDLIVGAPGYGVAGNPQSGRVFVVFGRDGSTVPQHLDLDKYANITLYGINWKNGHFGAAVTVLDFNQDGLADLAVGAPSSGSAALNYTGAVHVYLAKSPGVYNSTPSVSITCKSKYCNLGWSLASADLNQDGHRDLIVGSPFVANSRGQRQSGALWAVYSRKGRPGTTRTGRRAARKDVFVENEGTVILEGDQQYGWLGYSLVAKPKRQGQGSWLLVSQPAFRICANPDCEFSSNDTQSVGRLLVYDSLNLTKPVKTFTGDIAFGKLGSSCAIGDPYDNGQDVLGLGADTRNVAGKILGISTTFTQAGSVNLLSLGPTVTSATVRGRRVGSSPLASLEGDRGLGRFGGSLLIGDVTGDGIDDVIIGAPLRIEDVTEELARGEQGAVYILQGGKSFPRGNATRECHLLHKVIEPCPEEKSLAVLYGPESGSRFGHLTTAWRNGKTTLLVVSAPRSSREGRLSGSLFLYTDFN